MAATRQGFQGLAHWEIVLWYCLAGVSTALFLAGTLLLVRKYRRGRRGVETSDKLLLRRIGRTAWIILSHAWIKRRDGVAGLAHAFVFYGFMVLFAGTTILAIDDDLTKPAFGFDFWRGDFYLGYSLFLDVFGAAMLVGLIVFAAKRLRKPFRLDYSRPDRGEAAQGRALYVVGDWMFLGVLAFLGATGFLLEAFRIAQFDPSFEIWSPVGWVVGHAFRAAGLKGEAAGSAHHAQWWVHGVTALAFVAAIPFTKALHILAGSTNVAVRDEHAGKRLPLLPPNAKPEEIGYALVSDISWQHLVSLDACTRCGKCHAACPATAAGYPLSPRDLILDLREAAESSLGSRAALHVSPARDSCEPLLGATIRPETVWSCMQCMACVEICPVGIEHVPIINQLRRHLVEAGEMDGQLQSALESVYETGNSFGEPSRKRPRWTRGLDFEVKNAGREPVDVLWFVGDYASFDSRNQRATQRLAEILRMADVDFGILFEAEKTAGCDIRRVGEEGLWASLAHDNIALLNSCEFERILTSDPHTFHTIRNEYPSYGGEWKVVHHSQLLLELLEDGRIPVSAPLGRRVTYHDPCTLGRYNGVYEEPREVLRKIGCDLFEMPRNRDNSFCCGAGGGRIWMDEVKREGARRPSEQRIDEAVALDVALDYFVVACPKDATMYEDAIKTSGHQGAIELRELSELVFDAVQSERSVSRQTDAVR